jgi:hypothetical protein
VITGATESVVFSEIGLSFNDITISTIILFSLYFILKFQDEQKTKFIMFSGFLSGVAFGCKLTIGLMVVALIVAFMILNFKKGLKYNIKYFLIYSLFSLFGFLIIDGYWMFLLYKNFHNPIFPLYNRIFKSDLYTFINYRDLRFDNINYKQLIAYPLFWSHKAVNFVCEFEVFDYRHSFAYFALVISSIIFFIKFIIKKSLSETDRLHLFIIVFSVVSFVLWIKMTSALRYYLTILSLTGVLITIFISQIRLLKSKLYILIPVLCLIISLFFSHYVVPDWGRLDRPLEVPPLPLEKNSVVFLYGKPISYIAALPYDNVRFISLSDRPDGAVESLKRTELFYKKIDLVIKDKKKHLIIHKDLIDSDKNYLEFIKPRYVNSKLRCKTIQDISINKASHMRASNFYFCEYLD